MPSSMIGERLGPYRIDAELGRGGMGEVFRATDTRLGREVALKVLAAPLSADAGEPLDLLQREARSLAALDHPNIVTLFSIEEAAGRRFLTMQLVRGRALDALVSPGGMELPELLRIATQLADALSAAHERGIVHRDLKPSNVMVDDGGRIRVLDFGVARLAPPVPGPGEDAGALPTLALTRQGVVEGTLAYMAPEQLEGRDADPRSDIYSLGVLLYELATGERPFSAKSSAGLAAAILRDSAPALAALRPDLPSRLDRILRRCLEKKPGARYQSCRDLGHAFEDLARDETPAAAAGSGTVPRSEPAIDSLAVLPLRHLASDPEHDYFSDGLTETLIAALSGISSLRVISRTSVLRFKSTERTLPEIARALGVAGILEGSVQRVADRVRITVKLVGAFPERNLWAETFDRELTDVLDVSSDVARAVAAQVAARLTPEERERLGSPRPVVAAAYEEYLKGRHQWESSRFAGFAKAVAHYRRSIELDPGYALPHVALVEVYGVGRFFSDLPPVEEIASAARRALEIGPDLAEAHAAVGIFKTTLGWDRAGAESAFRRALELGPSYAFAHQWYGWLLGLAGRFDEAVPLHLKSLELDPLSSAAGSALARTLFRAGRYGEAEERLRGLLELDPGNTFLEVSLGEIHLQTGRLAEAMSLFEAAARSDPNPYALMCLGVAQARAGDRAAAERALARIAPGPGGPYLPGYLASMVLAHLGRTSEAIGLLEAAFAEGSPWITWLGVEPMADPLRGEPRFQALLGRALSPGSG